MLISVLILALSGPVTTPLHAQSASAMPIGHVVRDRSAAAAGEPVREVCYRGKRTGSNVIEDLCRLVPVEVAKPQTARR